MIPEYLDNKYTKAYNSIIGAARARGAMSGYSEVHHVIPKSLGGSNRKENLVRLTPKEHFICHRLLPKMTSGTDKNKMLYAIRRMVYKGNIYQDKRHKATSRTYAYVMEQVKLVHSAYMKNNNPMHNPNVRVAYDIAIKSRGKTTGMTGKKHTSMTKQLMRQKRAAQVITEESKEKIRQKIKALVTSEGYINAMHRPGVKDSHLAGCIERSKNHRTTCEHCNGSFVNNTYARWHGDKCRKKV